MTRELGSEHAVWSPGNTSHGGGEPDSATGTPARQLVTEPGPTDSKAPSLGRARPENMAGGGAPGTAAELTARRRSSRHGGGALGTAAEL